MATQKPTLPDRLIAWLAPGAAVRRAQARSVLAYFEAAQPSRLRKNRRATGSANDDILKAGASLRQTARHLEQNYDLALGVLNTLVANVVGPHGIGVEPQPRRADGTIDDELARQILNLWKDWQRFPEVTRQHDWPSAQRLMARSWFRDGEVFGQVVAGLVPSLDHRSRVPLSLELLEADYVPMDLNTLAAASHGGQPTIVQGVELNAWGAPVAYHVFKADPLASGGVYGSGATKRLSADRVLHLKTAHRIRQARGVSVFASVLNRFDDLKDYEESERIAAKIAASMAAYIRKGAPDQYNPELAGESQREMKFRPGMVFDDLRPGEEIGMIDTNRPNPNLETYRSGQMKAIAAGTGPTFSSIARTYDGTYSAQRQELVEGYAAYGTLSAEFISRVSRPVYEQFIAVAVASGALKVPAGIDPETVNDAAFMPPAMPWIDPKKEAEAWGMLEDRAYASGPEIIRRRGGNPLDTLEQQARWNRAKAAQGIAPNAAQPPPTERKDPPDPADPAGPDAE
jgi:lambda family phage portal protein